MHVIRTILLAGIPFIVAVAACFAAFIWIFGIPGDWNAEYVPGWMVGGIAIASYLHAYAIYAVAAIVIWLAKWRLMGLLHTIIWVCMTVFLVVMAFSVWMISASA